MILEDAEGLPVVGEVDPVELLFFWLLHETNNKQHTNKKDKTEMVFFMQSTPCL